MTAYELAQELMKNPNCEIRWYHTELPEDLNTLYPDFIYHDGPDIELSENKKYLYIIL